jgi:biotin synthase-like enzyme
MAKIESKPYMAISGKGEKNCKYCPFKTDYVKKIRIREKIVVSAVTAILLAKISSGYGILP